MPGMNERLGPSLLHSAGALALTGIGAAIGGFGFGNGAAGAINGATVASTWFFARETTQIAPHWGWKTWRFSASPEQWNRLARQAGWPAALAMLLAAHIIAARPLFQ